MAAETVISASVAALDSLPIKPVSSGQGGAARLATVDDFVSVTAAGLQASKSTYRLVRFPTGAIPKSLFIATTVALDVGTHALVFDLNVAFSDSTMDGTPVNLQGLIPTTANDGQTMTTVASYSSPNKIFGTINNASTSVAYTSGELIANGSQTNYPLSTLTQQPLWQTLGFVDGRGNPADPNGYFDLMAVVSTPAGTGAAGKLYCRFSYAL